jgi:hypothetical protein
VACINLDGEAYLFKGRRPCFEEIKWMVLAAVGANYQGVVWRGQTRGTPFEGQLGRLVEGLRGYGEDLGQARAVGWVRADRGPASAVCTEKRLFVVVLDGTYLRPLRRTRSVPPPKTSVSRKGVALPMDVQLLDGELAFPLPAREVGLTLLLPEGRTIESGRTLSGVPVDVTRQGKGLRVNCKVRGAGELLIFSLGRREGKGSGPSAEKSLRRGGE